jgi:hypothetical protein
MVQLPAEGLQDGQNEANPDGNVPLNDGPGDNNPGPGPGGDDGVFQQPQPQARQRIQHSPSPDRDRRVKSRTPDLVTFFKSLSLRAQLEWNKGREDHNLDRERNRIVALSNPLLALSDSEDESIFSLAEEDLDALCDSEIYNSYSDYLPQKLKLQLASRKRKRGSLEGPKEVETASPESKRRRMNGKSLENLGNQLALLKFPDVMFDTENAKVFVPLPLFHPECIQYIVGNLNRVPLMRVNPSPGELKGQLVLDVTKLCVQFGEESSPAFTFDRFLASSVNYVRFQTMCDAEVDPVTRSGNGLWLKVWFNHFNFFLITTGRGQPLPPFVK